MYNYTSSVVRTYVDGDILEAYILTVLNIILSLPQSINSPRSKQVLFLVKHFMLLRVMTDGHHRIIINQGPFHSKQQCSCRSEKGAKREPFLDTSPPIWENPSSKVAVI